MRNKGVLYPAIKAYTLVPTLLNLTIVLNYFFSYNTTTETYHFKDNIIEIRDFRRNGTGGVEFERSSRISLENKAYKSEWAIRTFSSYQAIRGIDQITYTFKEGLFGLRVMTDYRFH